MSEINLIKGWYKWINAYKCCYEGIFSNILTECCMDRCQMLSTHFLKTLLMWWWAEHFDMLTIHKNILNLKFIYYVTGASVHFNGGYIC